MTTYILMTGACVAALGIGCYLYAIAASKCIKENLFAIIKNFENKNKRSIRDQLIEFIDFHTKVKQLSKG